MGRGGLGAEGRAGHAVCSQPAAVPGGLCCPQTERGVLPTRSMWPSLGSASRPHLALEDLRLQTAGPSPPHLRPGGLTPSLRGGAALQGWAPGGYETAQWLPQGAGAQVGDPGEVRALRGDPERVSGGAAAGAASTLRGQGRGSTPVPAHGARLQWQVLGLPREWRTGRWRPPSGKVQPRTGQAQDKSGEGTKGPPTGFRKYISSKLVTFDF